MTPIVRGALAIVLGVGMVGAVAPKKVRVAGVFDVGWTGKEPLSLREVKEADGQVVMTLVNETSGVVDGVQIGSTPPPEGGCKKVTHPFSDEKGLGLYARPYPTPGGKGAAPAAGLNVAPAGTIEVRISAAEVEAWTKRRKLLRCDPNTPSHIWLNRVCLRDGSEWAPPGWNVNRTAWCSPLANPSPPR